MNELARFESRLSTLTVCELAILGKKLSLSFSGMVPTEPGVYVLYQCFPEKPVYVGESRNLQQRLKFLFRCHPGENPHPFHKRHKQIYGQLPSAEEFCSIYGVRWLTTNKRVGRIEIEEALQETYGTNNAEFYKNFDPDLPGQDIEAKDSESDVAQCPPGCMECAVWAILANDKQYLSPVRVSAMGSRGADLFFKYESNDEKVHVWRQTSKLKFSFGKQACREICQRYQAGLAASELPHVRESGGTSYFTDPNWLNPVLGRINTPYAAAIIRHILRNHKRQCQ